MEKSFLFIIPFIHWIQKEDKYVGKGKSDLLAEYTIFHLGQIYPLRTHIYHPRFPPKCQCFC